MKGKLPTRWPVLLFRLPSLLPSAKTNPARNPGSRSPSPLGWAFENPRDLFRLFFSVGESLHKGPQPDKAIHQQTDRSTQASPRSWEAICCACFPPPLLPFCWEPCQSVMPSCAPWNALRDLLLPSPLSLLYINLVSYRLEGCISQA